MTGTDLPITVDRGADRVDLVVAAPPGSRWRDVRRHALAAADLPAGTALFLAGCPVPDAAVLGRPPLLAGSLLGTEATPPAVDGPYRIACVAGPDAGRSVAVSAGGHLMVGRAEHADLRLDDPHLSRRHAVVHVGPDGPTLRRISGSPGGTGPGGDTGPVGDAAGQRADPATAPGDASEDAIGTRFHWLGGSLIRCSLIAETALRTVPDGAGRLLVTRPARVAPPFSSALPAPPGPSPTAARRPLPLLAALLGGLAGVGIAVVTGQWMFLLLAALGPVMTVGQAVGDRLTGRRGHRRALADHRAALAQDGKDLAAAVEADRADAWDRYPDPVTLLLRAQRVGHRLWERRRTDPDFTALVLGVGDRPGRWHPPRPDPVRDVPLPVRLADVGVLGLTGDAAGPMLRWLICQLVTLHGPADLRIRCGVGLDWARLRLLPHCDGLRDDPRADLLTPADLAGPGPAVRVLILTDADRWRRQPLVREWLARAAAGRDGATTGSDVPPRLLAICLSDDRYALPAECIVVVRAMPEAVSWTGVVGNGEAHPVAVDADYLDRLLRALAALRDPDDSATALPSRVGLAEICGHAPYVAAIRHRWARPQLIAALGSGIGAPVRLDLERDGPHLLIAGTTGAGKSELLRTLVVGLALSSPPDRCSFLLIDYKGGAAFGRLADLPHVVGMITDLDAALAQRALTSLRAELRRRERVLSAAGHADLASMRAAAGTTAPASLVLVVDEFATLAADLPDFLSGLLDIAQRGRSLGVHLVLSTQRPAGVLHPAVRANIGARICLRVTDPAESSDVLGCPDAALLPPGSPGRALLRLGSDPPTPFQTAQVGLTAPADIRVTRWSSRPEPPETSDPRAEEAWLRAIAQAAHGRAGRPAAPWLPALPFALTGSEYPDLFALVDRPDLATQPRITRPQVSVLVVGPPGSGRSTALRRLAALHVAHGASLVLIDEGRQLRAIGRWSATTTDLDCGDPALAQRLVQRLHETLIRRTAAPHGGEPDIVLIVDGLIALLAALDQVDFGAGSARLAEVVGRGPAVGIRVAASGEPSALHHRIAQQFGLRIALATDGRGGAVPGAPPGRGHGPDGELQLVFEPDDGVEPGPTRAPDCGGSITVRSLPDLVELAALPDPLPGAVGIGLGGDDAGALHLDLTGPGLGILVAGPRRSGVSTALRVLARQAGRAGVPTLRLVPRPAPGAAGVTELAIGDVDAVRLFLVAHDGPLLVTAELLGDDDPIAPLLREYLTVAGEGQHLAVGARLDVAARSRRGLIAEVGAFRTGLLLQADAADGQVLDLVLPRRRGPTIPGRGHLVVAGAVHPLQVARLEWPT